MGLLTVFGSLRLKMSQVLIVAIRMRMKAVATAEPIIIFVSGVAEQVAGTVVFVDIDDVVIIETIVAVQTCTDVTEEIAIAYEALLYFSIGRAHV